MTTPAGDLLRHVADIVDGARNKTHGDKERSFRGIGNAWAMELARPVTPSKVALLMVRLKEQRMIYGDPAAFKEHIEDILGYWAIHYELLELERTDENTDHGRSEGGEDDTIKDAFGRVWGSD